LPITLVADREFVALDDLAAAFQLTVRQETGAITVTSKNGTVVLTPDQSLMSVAGRLISLPAAPTRASGRLLVPLEFISRALAPIYDLRLDLRRPSRLLVVGDLRVPRITILHEPLANAARLTIEATPRTTSTVSQTGERLTVAFDADAIDTTIPTSLQAQGFVQSIRALDAVTLGIDLGPRFAAYRASTQTSDSAARLVIDLLSLSSEANPSPPAAPTPAAPAAAAAELRLLAKPIPALRTVAIDPGHGGGDQGVRGPGGILEKDLTLAVARRLKAALEGRLGLRVLLTREDDSDVPLDRRTAVANNNKADVFISLHANASPIEAASGASIRIAAFDDEERARASSTSERVPVFGGSSRGIDVVVWDLAQVRYIDQSAELAALVGQQFDSRVPLDRRPIGREPLRVLESANMPAVLIEMGYLTNADQERLLGNGDFQNTLAQALFDSLLRFRDVLADTGGLAGPGGER
jgi:N-acetylmuramoyl-L-alanine amidase